MLYIKLRKVFYGMLQTSLLLWKLIYGTLQEWGLKINNYDHCVANKNSILKAQRKQNWWMWMMQWSKYCGQAHVMLTQMNVREGILTFSEKGNEVTLIESKQLHDRKPLCL